MNCTVFVAIFQEERYCKRLLMLNGSVNCSANDFVAKDSLLYPLAATQTSKLGCHHQGVPMSTMDPQDENLLSTIWFVELAKY